MSRKAFINSVNVLSRHLFKINLNILLVSSECQAGGGAQITDHKASLTNELPLGIQRFSMSGSLFTKKKKGTRNTDYIKRPETKIRVQRRKSAVYCITKCLAKELRSTGAVKVLPYFLRSSLVPIEAREGIWRYVILSVAAQSKKVIYD